MKNFFKQLALKGRSSRRDEASRDSPAQPAHARSMVDLHSPHVLDISPAPSVPSTPGTQTPRSPSPEATQPSASAASPPTPLASKSRALKAAASLSSLSAVNPAPPLDVTITPPSPTDRRHSPRQTDPSMLHSGLPPKSGSIAQSRSERRSERALKAKQRIMATKPVFTVTQGAQGRLLGSTSSSPRPSRTNLTKASPGTSRQAATSRERLPIGTAPSSSESTGRSTSRSGKAKKEDRSVE